MSTSVNVNEPLSAQDRTRSLAERGTGAVNEPPSAQDRTGSLGEEWTVAVIAVLIAVCLACLVVNATYVRSLVDSVELGKDVGQYFIGP
jgi:hypothetical protein